MNDDAVEVSLMKLRQLDEHFGTQYPNEFTVNGAYPLRVARLGEPEGGNTEWTPGFVPGMLWAAGDLTGDTSWYEAARKHVPSFVDRLRRGVHVNTHDLGFLYLHSCVSAWRHDNDTVARDTAISAADLLAARVVEPAGIIQAWGDMDDPAQQGRTIVDSLMNMPLLYWASETSGDPSYARIAHRHALALSASIIRIDDTTHHTFHWDILTGEPLHGDTAQGFADDSTWARGQAWGIYGFALNYLHTGDERLLVAAERCAGRFISLLPQDHIPFWDMVFTDGSDEPRDSSAGAIAVCGLVELGRATGNPAYQRAADAILDSLIQRCATPSDSPDTCLLQHGVYTRLANVGVDEGNLWGDYYYLEALVRRQCPAWIPPAS